MVEDELVVYGNDHRGHGLTAKPSDSFGEFGPGGFDQLVEDMVSCFESSRRTNIPENLTFCWDTAWVLSRRSNLFSTIAIPSTVWPYLDPARSMDWRASLNPSLREEDLMKLMNAGFEPARTPFDWLSRDDAEVDAFINDPLCFPSLKPESMQSFLDAFPRLADPREVRKVRDDLPIYIFSGSDDPIGQRLEGVRVLIDRYRSAGFTSVAHDFYTGGRHEMLHEINRRDVITNLLVWLSGILERSS